MTTFTAVTVVLNLFGLAAFAKMAHYVLGLETKVRVLEGLLDTKNALINELQRDVVETSKKLNGYRKANTPPMGLNSTVLDE